MHNVDDCTTRTVTCLRRGEGGREGGRENGERKGRRKGWREEGREGFNQVADDSFVIIENLV